MPDPEPLLSNRDPQPFQLYPGRVDCPFLLTADHAGRAIPAALGTLGLAQAELDTHIAWDIGIAGLSERLARRLDAFLILQNYSRLVIDCNRPLSSPTSIATESEYTQIPGNHGLTPLHAEMRARAVFQPYHERIEQEFARRRAQQIPTIYVAMHSFTPRFKGVSRPWQCGVLYNRDARLASRLLTLLRQAGLEVGDNQPYFVTDTSDYGVPHYGEQLGHVHVELEVRQDLIADAAGQEHWAELLGRIFPAAAAPFLIPQ